MSLLETARRLTPSVPRVMWVENRPELVEGLANVMRKHDAPVNVHLYERGDEAKKALSSFRPDLVVVDLRLDQRIDGIAFIKHVRKTSRTVPVRIVSSFVRDYKPQLRELSNIAGIHERIDLDGEVGMRFVTSAATDAYVNSAARKLRVSELRLEEVAAHEERRAVLRFHWLLFGKFAMETIESQKLAWVAICGEEIVAKGDEMDSFPNDDELRRLDQQHRSAPFVYGRPVVSEESGVGLFLEQYPRCQLKIQKWGLANVDTGTNRTLVAEEMCDHAIIAGLQPGSQHGQPYEYGFRQETIFIKGDDPETDGEIGPFEMLVAVVLDWSESPWVRVNPERLAVVGRDFFSKVNVTLRVTASGNPGAVRTLFTVPKANGA